MAPDPLRHVSLTNPLQAGHRTGIIKATMSKLSPKTKQVLSGLAVVVGGAVLTFANAQLKLLPEGWQGIVGAILAGLAHYVPAAGTEQAVVDKLSKGPQ